MKRRAELLSNAGLLILMVMCLFFSCGCASIVSKSVYPVSICSEPTGADICIMNHKGIPIFEGKTPAMMDLKAGRGWFQAGDYTVEFTKPGYKDITIPIKQGLDGWYLFGNILVGGLIGWVIVDPITGAMWTIDDVYVNLQEETAALNPNTRTLRFLSLSDVPDSLRHNMVRIN